MNDFLFRLYRFVGHTRRLDREDFVSLCVGRHIERDPAFASAFLAGIAPRLDPEVSARVLQWCATPESERTLEARAQVPARSEGHDHPGLADLVVDLHPVRQKLIFEAKVDDAVPSPGQVQRYRDAFPEAEVLCLVEERERAACPEKTPVATWNDVLGHLPSERGAGALPQEREDLRRLMSRAGVGDARLALRADARKSAIHALGRFVNLEKQVKKMLEALGPNNDIRAEIKSHLDAPQLEVETSNAWGIGFNTGRQLGTTGIQGLALGVDAGDHADELVWRLEVCLTRADSRKALQKDGTWHAVRGAEHWFETEVGTTWGDRTLVKSDLAAVVGQARVALRQIPFVQWSTRGPGVSPYAPRLLSIPELREGIWAWQPVADALDNTAAEVVERLLPDKKKESYRRQGEGWRTLSGALPRHQRVCAWAPKSLDSLHVQVDNASAAAREAMKTAAETWRSEHPGDTLDLAPDACAVSLLLTDENWRSPDVVTCLVTLASAALHAR